MNVNKLDTKKTGLLFFDMLNVYYRRCAGGNAETDEAGCGQRRKTDGCGAEGIDPDFLCHGQPPEGRPDP